jgi:hypothetical protein
VAPSLYMCQLIMGVYHGFPLLPNGGSGSILLKNSIIWMGEFAVENQNYQNFTC